MFLRLSQFLALVVLFLVSFGSIGCFAEETELANTGHYVRLLKEQKNLEPIALQTSIEHLVGNDTLGPYKIDLVAAVHIAENSYYEDLNQRFLGYESLLFELIAEADMNRDEIGRPSDHPLSLGQKALQNMLGLSFQLEQVNYKARNFVHADMSPEQFSESMRQRGESVSQLLLKVMLQSMAISGERPPADLSDFIMLGFSKHRTIALRRTLARQFQDMETMITALNGSEGSTILSERNRVAVSVAKKQLSEGKRKLAIFYGGAHMPDMKKQLQKELKVSSEGFEWLTAWNLEVS